MAGGQRAGGAGGLGGAEALAMRGAVDLGALAQAREAQAAAAERAKARAEAGDGAGALPAVFDVAEATFQAEVVERSYDVPVVIDFWAEWCEPCKSLSPILERLAIADDGRWLLAKIDVDANQRLAQAFGVQSIPSLFAVVAGQPVPLFQGAIPEPQIRQVLDELLKVAAENGVTGRVSIDADAARSADAPAEVTESPSDPDLDAAADAVAAGDLDAAAAAYRRLLDRVPGDPDGLAGAALVGVMQRVAGVDPAKAVDAGSRDDASVEERLMAGDVLVLSGRSADGFALLIAGVKSTFGDDRAALRDRILELFAVLGPEDPTVIAARPALANALF